MKILSGFRLACFAVCMALALRPCTVPAQEPDVAGSERARQMFARFPNRGQLSDLSVPPRTPQEALNTFTLPQELVAEVVLHEPTVRQPVFLNFDERGRMWVVQLLQYPYPAGLKIVDLDHQFHASYDRVPPPPPYPVGSPFRGRSLISIHNDTDSDGTFEQHKVFLDGLSIVTAVEHGSGGVWVLHPPYLLFYADQDRDDRPDGDPVVHLEGFGMEDTHATANSLRWGPDGWLYGAQGSGCSATIRRPGIDEKGFYFKGQAIWRYHPETRRFELFAEGGGNTYGVEFDAEGNLFSGHNGGDTRGFHFVQGGNYQKSWGEHGYLTNPYAFGYFGPMRHASSTPRFSHTFVIYESEALGPNYQGRILAPVPLHNVVMISQRTPSGSTYFTRDTGSFFASTDRWFRPVDIKVGPEGAVYIADWYDTRLSHMNPRDTWDREHGRIYRVRTKNSSFHSACDLRARSTGSLVELLQHPNKVIRQQCLRLLRERQDREAIELLRARAMQDSPRALDVLWALHALGASDAVATTTLRHPQPAVRAWTVRLLVDSRGRTLPDPIAQQLVELARSETHPPVRSQLASSAKRLSGDQAIPLIREFLKQDADAQDEHLPLLVWWALEDKAQSHREQVLEMFRDPAVWRGAMGRQQNMISRLARRYAAYPQPGNQAALATLLQSAPDEPAREQVIRGVQEAFRGGKPEKLLAAFERAIEHRSGEVHGAALGLAVRREDSQAIVSALAVITEENASKADQRVDLMEAVADGRVAEAIPVLLEVIGRSEDRQVRIAALSALARFDEHSVAEGVLSLWPMLDPELRGYAAEMLCRRKTWARELLRLVVDVGVIPRQEITNELVQRIRLLDDAEITALADRYFGPAAQPTSDEKRREIEQVAAVLTSGAGDSQAGKKLYAERCASCHKLYKEGGRVGPDLTGYERTNLENMILAVVDPSAAIREGFVQQHVLTKDGRSLVGVVAERDGGRLVMLDALGQQIVIPEQEIEAERALSTSIMPEGTMRGLSDQQIRDLFAYVASSAP